MLIVALSVAFPVFASTTDHVTVLSFTLDVYCTFAPSVVSLSEEIVISVGIVTSLLPDTVSVIGVPGNLRSPATRYGVIVTVPSFTARTTPLSVTVATFSSLD